MAQGADVFRLNMSHARHEWVRAIVPEIRRIAAEIGRPVAVLMDTQGPAIRTGDLKTNLELKPGDILEFTVRGAKSEEAYSVDVNYDGLVNDISAGDTVLVDNGVIQMLVLEKRQNRIRCKVLTPGTLGSRRHINLPGVRVNLPPLTEKDLADVQFGAEVGVDFFALSFARQASDVEELRRAVQTLGSKAQIVAKIEDQSAVRDIDAMIEAADAIMVARGDLGIECPMEELPIIQRKIVKQCLRFGKPVIVATHMLESMIENPVPTRAEITDVANAVFEQADAIMLSGETTTGRYPVKCVEVFDRVARRIERSGGAQFAREARPARSAAEDGGGGGDAGEFVAESEADRLHAARDDGALRFQHAAGTRRRSFAFTPSEHIWRQLALCWGTHPVLLEFTGDPNKTIEAAAKHLCETRLDAAE